MWPLERQQRYQAVGDLEVSRPALSEKLPRGPQPWPLRTIIRICLAIFASLLALAVISSLTQRLHHEGVPPTSPSHPAEPANGSASEPSLQTTTTTTTDTVSTVLNHTDELSQVHPQHASRCRKRREWRTLKPSAQHEYIEAVQCLRALFPANHEVESNYTAYDDFPVIDAHVGYATFDTAAYLPWHRQFLHLYEKTLRRRCGFRGQLPYWDWTLDHDAFWKSPILDPLTGFGGDGEVDGQHTVGRTGRCVADGPFAHLIAPFWNADYKPHCLSRGFQQVDSSGITPDSIEDILRASTYEDFTRAVDSKIRDTIPTGIGGEFEASTASYDPLFFLHFTQLDRIWWMWQQEQPRKGVFSYGGKKTQDSFEAASLDDKLRFGGLGKTITVKDVMNTQGKILCYKY